MDGLFIYAEIFSSWVEHFSYFWSILNSSCSDILDSLLDLLSSTSDFNLAVGFLNLTKILLDVFGFSDLTIFGLIFSCMGTGFGIYFAIVFIKWFLNIIK